MRDASLDRPSEMPTDEIEHHEYHSAVEVDESVDNWRDWIGPALAVLFLVAALIVVVLMLTGQL